MLKLPLIFQEHMVLQRNKPISIWGTAQAKEQVTVVLQGISSTVKTDQNGQWQMIMGPFNTSFHETLTVSCGKEELHIDDIQIGEVWLAGGQSNMEFCMRYDADFDSEKNQCTNDSLRFFDYPEVSYVGQIEEADYLQNYGFWRKATPEQLERFSAVGYYFAKEIQKKYQIPVGIIGCNWGGTPACAWMSKEAIIQGGGQVYLDEYEEAIRNLDLNEYNEKFKNNPSVWKVDQFADPISELLLRGCSMEEFGQKIAESGVDLSKMDPADFAPMIGPKYEQRPGGLYESMLKQIAPYTIKGVIWYQGETDGDSHPEIYKTLFPALIQNWRELWNEQLPFLFVQIAPLERWMQAVGEKYVEIRKAQQDTADTVPGTAMAVITDVGMQFDIHPKKKQPVGHRLALLAENKIYHEDLLCEAPMLNAILVEDGKLELTFTYVGGGLYLAEELPYSQKAEKNRFNGLQVFQNGKELSPELLSAKAEKDKVVIFGKEIKANAVTEVRVAKTGWYQVNLYNSADIPARPTTYIKQNKKQNIGGTER